MTNKEEINVFGETNFRNKQVHFGIKPGDRLRHMYVIGKTGMGKSHLLRTLAYNDIQAGRGLAFVDPHGDSADWLLDYIPKDRINDVVFLNPTDIDFPVAFNVLEKVDKKYHNLVADGLVGVFKKIWAESWGPRLEYLMRNAILALLDYQDTTLLGVTRVLIDKSYRKKVIKNIHDPVVKAFWVDEFSKYHDRFLVEAISPIQNKVGQFLSNSIIRNIVGQPKSTINMREIMDEGKILILNLSKGKIGEESSALLGAMIITKLQLAAMSRADIPEEERRDFFLYVDEFQTFATESFADILSEARKYALGLIMAHQYVEQVPEAVTSAVFGNVGTIISFRVSAIDAEMLEKEFEPIFMQNHFVNLPKYSFYTKLMIDGITGDGFSAATIPMEFEAEGSKDKVVKVSRERYANPREMVEEKIKRWSGVFERKDDDDQDDKPGGKGGQKPPVVMKKARSIAEVRASLGLDKKPVPKSKIPVRKSKLQPQSKAVPVKKEVSAQNPQSQPKPKQNPIEPVKVEAKKPVAKAQKVLPKQKVKPTVIDSKINRRPDNWQPPKPPQIDKAAKPDPPKKSGISLNEALQQKPQSVHKKKSGEEGKG